MDLANQLLDRKTQLLGTLHSNCKGNPKVVASKELKVGEAMALENPRGIALKWHDKRDMLMISTMYTSEVSEVTNRLGKNQINLQ